MIRFCQQRDQYSCGPIALLNIDKFFGRRVTYKHLPRYHKRTRCSRKRGGTFTRDISKILGRAKRGAWKTSKQFLQVGGCIMIQTSFNGHYFLMVMNHEEDIGVVNYSKGRHAAICITPQQAARWLKKAYRTWYVSKPTTKRNPR